LHRSGQLPQSTNSLIKQFAHMSQYST
jgi:hypothetical protein